jgi:DNA-binding MarR family transcriptional regulator
VINVPLTIESLVAILLLLTILYCVRLNSQLKQLRADEGTLRRTIAELVAATETAERAIAGLRATVKETDDTLGERLRNAEQFSADIVRYTEAGGEVLSRLAQIAGVHLAQTGTPMPDVQPVANPKSIAAAAQAFADRARARLKDLAA